jgi:uncharacterized protein (TIGR02217 family)
MAFYESPRFPEHIARGAMGGPTFSTTVAGTLSGREKRNIEWAYPLQEWDVSAGLRHQADFEAVRAFFLVMRGMAHGWRFKDWTDYAATAAQGVVQGLTSTTFQMVKRYSSGAQTLDRVITKPVAGTVTVYVSGSPDGTASVNTATGVITIASAPAPGLVGWAGEFDVPMRFNTDQLQARVVGRNPAAGLLHDWGAIPIRETRDIA